MYCADIIKSWKPRLEAIKDQKLRIDGKLFSYADFIKQLNKGKKLNTSVNYFSRILRNDVNLTIKKVDSIEKLLRYYESLVATNSTHD
jgi:TnpA family transposase